MDREAGVLQDRIEVAALQRRHGDPQERVRGRENEEIERGRDPCLHGKDVGLEPGRQVPAEDRDQGAEHAEDEDPQHHRAFVVPPHAGDLVDERLRRMGILEHVDDGKIRPQVARHQRAEGDRHETELRDRRGRRHAHQRRVVAARAVQRHAGLHQRQSERQHERVMAKFGDHWRCLTARAPARPRLSAFRIPSRGPAS